MTFFWCFPILSLLPSIAFSFFTFRNELIPHFRRIFQVHSTSSLFFLIFLSSSEALVAINRSPNNPLKARILLVIGKLICLPQRNSLPTINANGVWATEDIFYWFETTVEMEATYYSFWLHCTSLGKVEPQYFSFATPYVFFFFFILVYLAFASSWRSNATRVNDDEAHFHVFSWYCAWAIRNFHIREVSAVQLMFKSVQIFTWAAHSSVNIRNHTTYRFITLSRIKL